MLDKFDLELVDPSIENGPSDYDEMTELDWAEYEFGTVEYDYKVHPEAARIIRLIFKRLYNG